MSTEYWTAGAHGRVQMDRDGWFSFTVPQEVQGVIVGIVPNDVTTSPTEITHGIAFVAGKMFVIESYTKRTEPVPYEGTEEFHVVRVGALVYYCRGTVPTRVPGVAIELPGELIYASEDTMPLGYFVYLDASLLAEGDRVNGARLTQIDALEAEGSAFLLVESLELGGTDQEDGGTISMGPLALDTMSDGDGGEIGFLPMAIFASEDEYSQGSIDILPMYILGLGAVERAGPRMSIVLPSFSSGEGEVIPEPGEVELVADELWVDGDPVDMLSVMMVTETIEVAGEPFAMREGYVLAESTITFLDGVLLGGGFTLADELIVDDEAITTSGTVMLTDVIELIGEPEVDAVYSAGGVMVGDVLVMEGDGAFLSLTFIEELIEVDDATMQAGGQVVADELIVDDEVITETRRPMVMVSDELVIDDEVVLQVESLVMVEDVLIISDEPLLRGQGLMAWVMNTETTGVSWYENWEFTGMVQVGNQVLAIGPAGLALLGADSDAGVDIDASIELGYTDFGGYRQSGRPKNDQFLKQHVVGVWVGYRADGVLDATVQTHGNHAYTYRLEKQPASTPRNSRFKPGKGLNERFWAFSFANVAGCAFEINSLAAEVVPSKSRRI